MIGEDIGLYGGAFGVSVGLIAEFGEDKIMDSPISEQGIVGVAIGVSLLGMRPIVEIMFSDFMMLPLEQIANQAAKMRYMFGGKAKVPIVIRDSRWRRNRSGCTAFTKHRGAIFRVTWS